MALHYDLGEINDYKNLCYQDAGRDSEGNELTRIDPDTDSLIWATMAVGIGEITDRNYIEFWIRMNTLHMLWAGMRGDTVNVMPLATVKAHIGLSTNVAYETSGKWFKRIVKGKTEEIQYQEERKEKEDGRATAN